MERGKEGERKEGRKRGKEEGREGGQTNLKPEYYNKDKLSCQMSLF